MKDPITNNYANNYAAYLAMYLSGGNYVASRGKVLAEDGEAAHVTALSTEEATASCN